MKKNVQTILRAASQMLRIWRKTTVFFILLFSLCLLEHYQKLWYSFEITSNIQLTLAQTVIFTVLMLGAAQCVIVARTTYDGYNWWRILGYIVGGVGGSLILLLARGLIWSFTMEGFFKGWTILAGAELILKLPLKIAGWRRVT